MSPRLTVLMPVFNRERYVDEAIRSVLEQDFADFELLLVDDGSTDGTAALLRARAERDPRITIVTAPRNEGIPGALNRGLTQARARYIARLDSDDIMLPGRLAAQVAVLDERPDVVLVSCAYDLIDERGAYLTTWRGDEPHEVMLFLLNFYNIVGGGGQVAFRRDEVLAEGGYSTRYPSSEDYDLWVRLLRCGRIVTLPLVGMQQRQHDARSHVQYADVKRANWSAIMRGSLERYLGRAVAEEEIAALITVWRHDGRRGAAPRADRTMREAFARFCGEHRDRGLRRCARRRIARQWTEGARAFARAGERAEAVRYLARAARWWW